MSMAHETEINILDLNTTRITTVSTDEIGDLARKNSLLTRAMPPRIEGGHAVFSSSPETHSLSRAVLRRVEAAARSNGYGKLDLSGLTGSVVLAPQPIETIIDMVTEVAADIEKTGDKRQAEALVSMGISLERKNKPSQKTETSPVPEKAPDHYWNLIEGDLKKQALSTGEQFGGHVDILVEKRAQEKVGRAKERITTSFSSVVTKTLNSLEENLEGKKKRLTPDLAPEDRRDLVADITAIQANIQYCQIFLEQNADYNNFNHHATELKGQVQDQILQQEKDDPGYIARLKADEISEGETKLQAITSLEGQFNEVKRQRDNAQEYLFGNPDKKKEGLSKEAIRLRKRTLSQETDEDGIPVINKMAANEFAQWLSAEFGNQFRPINSTEDLLQIVHEYWGDDITARDLIELLKTNDSSIDIDKFGFSDFIKKTYATSINLTQMDDLKADAMRLLMPAMEHALDFDIRSKYDETIDDIAQRIDTNDFVEAVRTSEHDTVTRDVNKTVDQTLDFLGIPYQDRDQFVTENKDSIMRVVLGYHELTINGNDQHLNEKSVVESLADAMINGDPLSLRIIRCLRWCYPDKQVEIAPHAGDYDTKSADGSPIVRKGWVEEEKLRIYKRAVIDPLVFHGFPIKDVTLLATGDYELVGDRCGYNMSPDHPQAINARKYVEDVRDRVPRLGLLGNIPVNTISFRELIAQYGVDKFEATLSEVQEKYDALFDDPDQNYLGFTGQNLERVIDTEHQHRIPFIAGWSRQDSRDFTRHVTTFGAALGTVVGEYFTGPQILTVSGNQYAGKNFSFGHLVNPNIKPLSITLINSVNDGDQSAHFRSMTTVIESAPEEGGK
jgi:hypothetical protein